jgi:hypothetical protein
MESIDTSLQFGKSTLPKNQSPENNAGLTKTEKALKLSEEGAKILSENIEKWRTEARANNKSRPPREMSKFCRKHKISFKLRTKILEEERVSYRAVVLSEKEILQPKYKDMQNCEAKNASKNAAPSIVNADLPVSSSSAPPVSDDAGMASAPPSPAFPILSSPPVGKESKKIEAQPERRRQRSGGQQPVQQQQLEGLSDDITFHIELAEPFEAAPPPPPPHGSVDVPDTSGASSVEEQIGSQKSPASSAHHLPPWELTEGTTATVSTKSTSMITPGGVFGHGKVPLATASEPDDVVMLETLGESLSHHQEQQQQQQQYYSQGFVGQEENVAYQTQKVSWQGTSISQPTPAMLPQAKRKRVHATENQPGDRSGDESTAIVNWNALKVLRSSGTGPNVDQQRSFGAPVPHVETVAAMRSLFETLISDATTISEFIAENVGSVIGSSGDSGVAPASWRDLDDIFKVGNPTNVSTRPALSLNDPSQTAVITLKVACEKLQLAVMHLSPTSLADESTHGSNLVDLAKSAARDFCRGIKCEVGHLVDTIMEREPFVRQLETMLAKELEKNKDYDHVHDRYEREVGDLKAELKVLRDEDRRLRLFIATMQGRMKGQLEVARRLLGPRRALFDANAYGWTG